MPSRSYVPSTVSMTFNGMNNVLDPTSFSYDYKQARMDHAVDLVNVDVRDDGTIDVRDRRTTALPTVDSVVVEGVTISAGSQTLTHGTIAVADRGIDAEYEEGYFDTWVSGGDCVDYYNGSVFRGGLLEGIATALQSKPYEYSTIDTRNHVAYLSGSAITMIGAVDDGIYIGTQNEVVFLSGDGSIENGFQVKDVLPYGVIKNTRVRTTGHKIPVAKMSGNVIVFATHRGVVVGGNGGNVVNISYGKVTYNYGTTGSAILREDNGQVHYVLMPGSGYTKENPYIQPVIDTEENSV